MVVLVLLLVGLSAKATDYYVRPSENTTAWSGISGATIYTLASGNPFAFTATYLATDTYYFAAGSYFIPAAAGITITTGKIYGGFSGNETEIDLNARATSDKDANGIVEPWEFTNETAFTGNGLFAGAGSDGRNFVTVTGGEINGITLQNHYYYKSGTSYAGTITLGTFTATPTKAIDIDANKGLMTLCTVKKIKSVNLGPIMLTNKNSVIDRCLIEECVTTKASGSGAIYMPIVGGQILNSVIRNNAATGGSSVGTIYATTSGTDSDNGSGNMNVIVKNCVIYNNTASYSAAIRAVGIVGKRGAQIINCTFANNNSTVAGYSSVDLQYGGTFVNSIVIGDPQTELRPTTADGYISNSAYGELFAGTSANVWPGTDMAAGKVATDFNFTSNSTTAGAMINGVNSTFVQGDYDAIRAANFKITSAASVAVTTAGLTTLPTSYQVGGSGATINQSATIPSTDLMGVSRTGNYTLGAYQLTTAVVPSGNTFTISQPTTLTSLTVNAGGKLTISDGVSVSIGSLTLESDASGTGTMIDGYENPTITATVQQYLPQGRNWYMASPIETNIATATNLSSAGASSVSYYNETSGWVNNYAGTLVEGVGYIAVSSAGTFTNKINTTGKLNTGEVPVTLTNSPSAGKGFNLVGNPYPSYLSWSAVASNSINTNPTTGANMPNGTMWYRTTNYNGKSAWTATAPYTVGNVVYNGTRFYIATSSINPGNSGNSGGPTGGVGTTGFVDGDITWDYAGSIYVFATVALDGTAASGGSNLIPPMQAFWVKSNGGTLTFNNSMRRHETESNKLKAPKSTDNEMPFVRLSVTNGAGADEAVIYTSTNASNTFDAYDAPKYFNTAGSNQPEIYTQVGNEKLVINAMSELNQGTEIRLGFATEKANNFTISASELRNLGSNMQVILKDKQTTAEFELTTGQSYAFSSGVINNTDRFSLLFRAPGVATGIENGNKLNAQVFVNTANQITIIAPEKCNYAIYNAMGQLIENAILNTKHETRNTKFGAGVYLVQLTVKGQSEIQKVIIR